MNKLKFSKMRDNAKLSYLNGYVFNLPAGHSCPAADKCLSKAVQIDGKMKVQDGKNQEFRCFAVNDELRYKNVHNLRWHNFNLLRQCKTISEMVELIKVSLPIGIGDYIRLHSSGDFFNSNYFRAWMIIAELNPGRTFYAYTKSINFIEDIFIPNNFKLTASYGGKHDHLIDELKLKHAKVFFSEEDAKQEGYKLDHTDELAYKYEDSFGLLLHAGQKAGSKASKAWEAIKKSGVGGYSKKNNIRKSLINSLVGV